MIFKEQLYKIFNLIIKKEPITQNKLNEYGINNQEFIYLLKKDIIEEQYNHKYQIKNYELLYECGLELINKREFIQGILFLEECYKNNHNNLELKLNLIFAYLNINKNEEMSNMLDKLKEKEITKSDFNLILYLLSIINKCPPKYIEKVLNMKYEDLILPQTEKQYNDIESQNTMRAYVMQNKFYYANRTYQNNLIKSFPNRTLSKIIEFLLKESKNIEEKRKKLIIDCIERKDYETIFSVISKKKQQMHLNLTDRLIYEITKDIITISTINKIPRPTIKNTNVLEKAINGKNYYLALKIITEQNNVISDKALKKSITSLLVDINKLMKKVYEEYKQTKTETTTTEITRIRKK